MPARSDRRVHAAHANLVTGCLTAAVLVPALAFAQNPGNALPWPGEADQKRVQQALPLPSTERLQQAPVKPLPRIEVAQPVPLDLGTLAHQGGQLGGLQPSTEPASGLQIFVTLDMPRASLVLLAEQAARSGAVLVLRGLKAQSMRQTLEALRALLGDWKLNQPNARWVIDPQAFERFGVQNAPTFVLSLVDAPTAAGLPFPAPPSSGSTCGAIGCSAPPPSLSVSGDVSLSHALGALARHSPLAAARAQPLLSRLSASAGSP